MANKKVFTEISKEKFQEIISNLDVIYFKGELKGELLIHNTALNRILGLNPSISLTGSLLPSFSLTLIYRKNIMKHYRKKDL
ncbi:MAG: hypothetical protein ACFFCY_04175 [Promethearchaeota archaeon]